MTLIRLGTYPTPVEPMTSTSEALWIKRDDRVAGLNGLYGGNKVRKLEHLLGAALSAGKTRIMTLGAAGSHQVVATALYGRREGFSVEAVLVPQPSSEHGRDNLRVALAHGLQTTVASTWPAVPAVVAARFVQDPNVYFIPLGGTNALGSMGFVDAAREVAAQVAAGSIPEPDIVVVAMGSGGTAAGLAVGFEELEMRTRVIGVAISQPVRVLSVMARRVAKKTAERVGLSRAASLRAAARVEVDPRWVGRGYGYPTSEGEAAMRAAASAGVTLDATYTAKAFACALALAREGSKRTILFWHTLSTATLAPLLAASPPLPPDLARLFH